MNESALKQVAEEAPDGAMVIVRSDEDASKVSEAGATLGKVFEISVSPKQESPVWRIRGAL